MLKLKVAIVHDWLVSYRGGERVLEAILELFPDAPIYTLLFDPKNLPNSIRSRQVIAHPSLRHCLKVPRMLLLPVLPSLIESFDLNDFDLVISSSACVAKGIVQKPGALHVSYIHSPMRYVWDQRQHYQTGVFRRIGFSIGWAIVANRMRIWDESSSRRVSHFVANSSFVAKRVSSYYGRNAAVVFPPVALGEFIETPKKDYYVVGSAMVFYKRLDLVIEACESLGRKLIVMGEGPLYHKLCALAKKHTTVIKSPSSETWTKIIREARAFVFAAVEDFGIAPLEAVALGTPILSLRAGGALDYLQEGVNGLFIEEQTKASVEAAILKFEGEKFEGRTVAATAQGFTKENFQKGFLQEVNRMLEGNAYANA